QTRVRQAKNADGPVVMLVDDDIDCVTSLARNLRIHGCEVIECVTVRDAINILNYDRPDIVISDGHMPFGGGASILDFINQGSNPPPVIVLSGLDSIEEAERYISL